MTQNEAKLASYHNIPFTKICVGMTRNNDTNWILVNYTATSLYSVMVNKTFHETKTGRAEWLSLIKSVRFQEKCNKEGFNGKFSLRNLKFRIGIVGNNEEDCNSCDSVISFGIGIAGGNSTWKWSSGSISLFPDTQALETFGYIFVQ